MIIVSKTIVTETAHRLLNYKGKCAHVHGHSYRWVAEVGAPEARIAPNGILIDFKEVKRIMNEIIFEPYDHALILGAGDPLLEHIDAFVPTTERERPRVVVTSFNPTAEMLAEAAGLRLRHDFRKLDVQLISLTVWETENSYARYVPREVAPESYR